MFFTNQFVSILIIEGCLSRNNARQYNIIPHTFKVVGYETILTFNHAGIYVKPAHLNGLVIGARCYEIPCRVPGRTVDRALVMLVFLANYLGRVGHMVISETNIPFL